MLRIKVQQDDFDAATETRKLTHGRHDVGAVASFIGLVRGEGERLEALELEHYPGMAQEQLTAIAQDAQKRWPVDSITVIHRYGKIAVGRQIVLVIATSRHRDAAFDAARHIMDYLKTDAPFWKKEHPRNGEEGKWVEGL